MHANSEIMGALPEREWIPRAPSLRRKLSLTAKVQDEVGHAQILYRIAEDLGKSREAMFEDLINGRTKFHNVFHYPTESWGDVAVIGWLIDGAALVTQRALLDSSYAPYVRAMRRICAEESLHLRHGEDLMLELVSGTDEQRAVFQDAVNRWWMPVWDVLCKRTEDGELVGGRGVMAPDPDGALLLARETHFRHKEGVAYAVRRRGTDDIVIGPYEASILGGVTDRSYRRQEAYA